MLSEYHALYLKSLPPEEEASTLPARPGHGDVAGSPHGYVVECDPAGGALGAPLTVPAHELERPRGRLVAEGVVAPMSCTATCRLRRSTTRSTTR